MTPDASEDFVPKTYGADVGQSAAAVFAVFFAAFMLLACGILLYFEWNADRMFATGVAAFWCAYSLFMMTWSCYCFVRAVRQKLILNRDAFTIKQGANSNAFDASNIQAIHCNTLFGTRITAKSLNQASVIYLDFYRPEERPAILTYFRTRFDAYLKGHRDRFLGKPDLKQFLWRGIIIWLLFVVSKCLILWDHDVDILQIIKGAFFITFICVFTIVGLYKTQLSRSSAVPTS